METDRCFRYRSPSSRPLPSPESLDVGAVKVDWLTISDLVEVKHGLDLVTLGLEPRLKGRGRFSATTTSTAKEDPQLLVLDCW